MVMSEIIEEASSRRLSRKACDLARAIAFDN